MCPDIYLSLFLSLMPRNEVFYGLTGLLDGSFRSWLFPDSLPLSAFAVITRYAGEVTRGQQKSLPGYVLEGPPNNSLRNGGQHYIKSILHIFCRTLWLFRELLHLDLSNLGKKLRLCRTHIKGTLFLLIRSINVTLFLDFHCPDQQPSHLPNQINYETRA